MGDNVKLRQSAAPSGGDLREALAKHLGWSIKSVKVGEKPIVCECGAVIKTDYRSGYPTDKDAWIEHFMEALAQESKTGAVTETK